MRSTSGARNQRCWTDDDLRRAVASHHSWRAVARSLGLLPSSTNNLRRHAQRLDLDTSHFSGKRGWSDHMLRTAIDRATTWPQALALLGIQDTGVARTRVRGHAHRLGLHVAHLDGPAPVRPGIDQARHARPRADMLRTAASAIAVAWFSLRGWPTVAAAEGQLYDLIVAMPSGFQRVQVKSTICRSKTGRWLVGVGRRPYSLDKTATKAPYDPRALDHFFIVTGDGDLYLVPSQALAGRTSVSIDSYPEYRVGDASSLLT